MMAFQNSVRKIRIGDPGEIPQTIAWLESKLTDCPPACVLICEELLNHLAAAGMQEILVSVRGQWNRRIEIRATGDEDDLIPEATEDENLRIAGEIQMNILSQYTHLYDFRYKKGVNLYRIYIDAPRTEDLSEELYSFYENAPDDSRNKPLSPLIHLFRKHPVRFVLAMIIKAVKHLAALMLPVFAANIIDNVISSNAFFIWPVLSCILGSFAALAINLICFGIDNHIYHRWTRAVESAFKLTLVRKVQTLSLRFRSRTPTGKLLTKLISDIQFIELLIYDRLTDVLHLCVDVVFVIVTALLRFPLMLLFYVIVVPAAVLFLRRASGPVLNSKAAMRKKTETANTAFKEMLDMDILTRSQGMHKTEYRKVSSKVRKVQAAADRYDALGVWVNNITYGGSQGFRLICLCFAAYLASRGAISVGTVVLFQSIFDMIINSVQKVLDQLPEIVQGYDSMISVNEILFEKDVELNGTKHLPEPVRGEITLRHVSFAYSNDQEPVLKDISLQIPAGGSVAFIGPSGIGKTTLLNLILGLYARQSGEILIDGVDLDELDKSSYRSHVAVVPQNTALFSGTLWDNLVYGLSYVSSEQVLEVLTRVGLDDLLKRLPDGLNSPVLENGSNLSGGQRQRIAIARALLRNPQIILFDEATSALDSESEKQVSKAIDEIMKHATVVMVAHRLNTLRKINRIYRLKDGKAIPCDSYDELIKNASSDGIH